MKYEGIIKKSRTLDFATLLTILGAVQMYLPNIADMLGKYNGITTFIIGVLVAYLRFVTKGKVGDK